MSFLLPRKLSQLFLAKVDHFAYHTSPANKFEGYYTRIQTNDGSSIVIILSSVHNANVWGSKSHFLHFSISPSEHSRLKSVRIDLHPDQIAYIPIGDPLPDGQQAFKLQADHLAIYSVDHNSQYCWLTLPHPDDPDSSLTFSARLTQRKPLKPSNILYTPHNLVVRLGSIIPVHWHIFSTCSAASYTLTRRRYSGTSGTGQRSEDSLVATGNGLAHIEKNWGKGFPDGWTWMQGFSQASADSELGMDSKDMSATLVLAGGTTGLLNINAYLVIYRSPTLDLAWDFAFPWTTLLRLPILGAWGPFARVAISKESASVAVDVSTLTRRIVISARSEEDVGRWLPLDCPLLTGHGNVTARETFKAILEVTALRRPFWLSWNPWAWFQVERRIIQNAGFEFGGEFRLADMLKYDQALESKKTR